MFVVVLIAFLAGVELGLLLMAIVANAQRRHQCATCLRLASYRPSFNDRRGVVR